MLNYYEGTPIAIDGNKILYLYKDDIESESEYSESNEEGKEILSDNTLEPLLDLNKRSVTYIAGKAGSGKTTFALMLIKRFLYYKKNVPFLLFSRTDYKKDPAYKGMQVDQVNINESLITDPINIEEELCEGAIVLFDDCNTIQDDKLKTVIEKLIRDIIEVGRKLNIWIILTNHLIIPDEKKLARIILHETDNFIFFPRSGAVQQIRYVLTKYFELDADQIDIIVKSKSRWTLINKNFPMYLIYNKGAYLLN